MHRLATLAAVGVLATASANCSNAREGANSANEIFPLTSVVAPSSHTEARAPGNGHGRGGNSNSAATNGSTLEVMMVNDAGTTGYSWGDTITFHVVTSETQPNVELVCSQNGVPVYGAVWPLTPNPTLSSGAWQGGAAECKATLYPLGDRKNVLATVAFTAAA